MTRVVVRQSWEESERGWGVRPDGYSLHLTQSDRNVFVRAYWDSMPEEVPDEYERPTGETFPVEVDEETFDLVHTSKNGIRRYQ